MDDERRARFIAYFEGPPLNGDRQKLITKSKYSKGRVAQWFDEKQPFGERAARELALRLGLDRMFFERDAGSPAPACGPILSRYRHGNGDENKFSFNLT